jgi:hypothetical protein
MIAVGDLAEIRYAARQECDLIKKVGVSSVVTASILDQNN